MPLVSTALNVIGRVAAGSGIPPDTIHAVGNDDDEGRILAVVNTAVVILNKATQQIISTNSLFFYGNTHPGDGFVSWDPYSQRFFLTAFALTSCGQWVSVLTPPAIAGPKCSSGANFGARNFSLSGTVEPASSILACGPVASLAGKIALVQRGTCGFVVKAKNVQNAGAIAMIVYNNVPGLVNMVGVDPTVVIPSVMVTLSDGLAIASNLPVTVSLTSNVTTTFSSTVYISVSNTSAPNDRNDFAHYQVVDGTYASVYADYPKHLAGPNAFYVTTQNFGARSLNGALSCLGANVRAFAKPQLLSGTGPVTLWDHAESACGPSAPLFVAPARTNAPIVDERLPDVFYGPDVRNVSGSLISGFSIYSARPSGLSSFIGFVPYPTPMSFGACTDSTCNFLVPGARQPPPAVPANLETNPGTPQVGVIHNNLLYASIVHNITEAQSIVRWFIIDVSPLSESSDPVLLQWGDLNVSPDIDTFFPAIDVSADGTMAISFYQSGPNQHMVASYTAHLPHDPPNSIRVPFRVAIPNKYTYFEDFGTGRNRAGDYIGLQVDPVDKRTFHAFVQRPDSLGFFFPPGTFGCSNSSACVSRDWVTDLFSFRIDDSTCPNDGVVTTARVLSSSPLPGDSTSVIDPADPDDFEVPLSFDRPEESEDEETEEAHA